MTQSRLPAIGFPQCVLHFYIYADRETWSWTKKNVFILVSGAALTEIQTKHIPNIFL